MSMPIGGFRQNPSNSTNIDQGMPIPGQGIQQELQIEELESMLRELQSDSFSRGQGMGQNQQHMPNQQGSFGAMNPFQGYDAMNANGMGSGYGPSSGMGPQGPGGYAAMMQQMMQQMQEQGGTGGVPGPNGGGVPGMDPFGQQGLINNETRQNEQHYEQQKEITKITNEINTMSKIMATMEQSIASTINNI